MTLQQGCPDGGGPRTDLQRQPALAIDHERIARAAHHHLAAAHLRQGRPDMRQQRETLQGERLAIVDLGVGAAGDRLPPSEVLAIDRCLDRRRFHADADFVTAAQALDRPPGRMPRH